MTLATRIGVMNHGEIVQIGTPTRHLRVPGLALRRRLHRLGEPVRGPHRRGRAGLRARRLRRARRHLPRRPRRQRRAGRDRLGRAAAGEDPARARAPGGRRRQPRRGRGRGGRLPRRPVDLPREARERPADARDAAEHAAPGQRATASAGTTASGCPGIRRARWWSRSEPDAASARRAASRSCWASCMAWIRAHGPWRWAAAGLRARGYSGRTLVTARAVPVAAAVLPGAVPDRAQDLGVRDPARDAALRAAGHLDLGQRRRPQDQLRELRVPAQGLALLEVVPELDLDGRDLDRPLPADRLPDGLRHRAQPRRPGGTSCCCW